MPTSHILLKVIRAHCSLQILMTCQRGIRGCPCDWHLWHLFPDFASVFPPTRLHGSVPLPFNVCAYFLSSVTALPSCCSWGQRTLSEPPPALTGINLTNTGWQVGEEQLLLIVYTVLFAPRQRCSVFTNCLICMKCLNKVVIWQARSHTLGLIATCFCWQHED